MQQQQQQHKNTRIPTTAATITGMLIPVSSTDVAGIREVEVWYVPNPPRFVGYVVARKVPTGGSVGRKVVVVVLVVEVVVVVLVVVVLVVVVVVVVLVVLVVVVLVVVVVVVVVVLSTAMMVMVTSAGSRVQM